MKNNLNILIVEDNKAICEAYKSMFEIEGNRVLIAHDADTAIRIINEHPKIFFDLLFTDIDLVGDPTQKADQSGIHFACYARRILPQVPVVGHSAYFDENDITSEQRLCFDEYYPKAVKLADRGRMFEQAIALAMAKRIARLGKKEEKKHTGDNLIIVPETEDDFLKLGYRKVVVNPDDNNKLAHPFFVWCIESDEGCELEVVGCPAILGWGENYEEAIDQIITFIHENKILTGMPVKELAGSSSDVATFINKIL